MALRTATRHLLLFTAYGLAGILAAGITWLALLQQSRPDTQAWHTAALDAEFRAGDELRMLGISDYQALEQRLFAQLDEQVYAQAGEAQRSPLGRYWPGSSADPRGADPDWNRTVVLPVADARGGVLLLHGLSDSPYSMRALAEHLHAQGWYVVALRLPGHGTAPAGLREVRWQDWAAAVRLAAKDLAVTVGPGKPLVLGGYSGGAALSLEYALSRLQGEALPAPQALVLFSPALGVSAMARYAVWQERLAQLPGLAKLAWVDLLPEYDPHKYNSFAVNAGEQAFLLTQRIDAQLAALGGSNVRGLPPLTAFQSVADATVSTTAVVDGLFRRLADEGHLLVLVDANRASPVRALLKPALFEVRDGLLRGPALPFDLAVLTNETDDAPAVSAWIRPAGSSEVLHDPTGLEWPADVFALSHVAVPFAADDPVYGREPPPPGSRRIWLGAAARYGERAQLQVTDSALLRLRHNPFLPWMLGRVDAALAP